MPFYISTLLALKIPKWGKLLSTMIQSHTYLNILVVRLSVPLNYSNLGTSYKFPKCQCYLFSSNKPVF